MEDVPIAIIGSGPTGYTAGVYNARARLNPTLFAGVQSGGQLMFTTDVENYPGFPEGKNGPELMAAMRTQAEKFGTRMIDKYVTAVDFSSRPFKLWTELPGGEPLEKVVRGGDEKMAQLQQQIRASEPAFQAQAVIIATGAVAVMLGIPGESEFLGRGVSTCAVCDAAFFKDKVVAVVGGGDSAMEDTLALTKFASKVYVLHRRDAFRASKIMQERVLNNEKVEVLWNTVAEEVYGDGTVNKIRIKTSSGGQGGQGGQNVQQNSGQPAQPAQQDQPQAQEQVRELEVQGFFLAIGHKPMSQVFKNQVAMDNHGYIVTRQSGTRMGVEAATQALSEEGILRFPTMTSVEGVFAAGDVVDVRYKQAVTAAAQGCAAAIDAERWLESQ